MNQNTSTSPNSKSPSGSNNQTLNNNNNIKSASNCANTSNNNINSASNCPIISSGCFSKNKNNTTNMTTNTPTTSTPTSAEKLHDKIMFECENRSNLGHEKMEDCPSLCNLLQSLPHFGVIQYEPSCNFWFIKLNEDWQNAHATIVKLCAKYSNNTTTDEKQENFGESQNEPVWVRHARTLGEHWHYLVSQQSQSQANTTPKIEWIHPPCISGKLLTFCFFFFLFNHK